MVGLAQARPIMHLHSGFFVQLTPAIYQHNLELT